MDLVSLFIRRCGAKNGSRSFRRQSPGLKKGPCLSDSSLSNRTYNHEKKKIYIYIYIYIYNRSFLWPLFPCEAIAMISCK